MSKWLVSDRAEQARPAAPGTRPAAALSFTAFVVAMLLVLVATGVALAQGPVDGAKDVACMGMPATACTAGDIDIGVLTVLNKPACLDGGTGTLWADVEFRADFVLNSTARYDVGLWISLNGGDAKLDSTNSCYVGVLAPTTTDDTLFNAIGGPFRDDDGDYCGDARQNDGTTNAYVETLRVKCVDGPDANGEMESISTCTSWDNNASTTCSKPADARPGTTSKCYCENVPISPPIVLSQIVVRKVTYLSSDTTTEFDFTVTGPGLTTNPINFTLTGGGGWASGKLAPGGTYSVVETAQDGWDLTGVVCTDGTDIYDPAGFTMPADKTVECVFTNTQRATISVRKITERVDGTAVCSPTTFNFSLSSDTTFGLKSYECADKPEAVFQVAPGTYEIAEAAMPGSWQVRDVTCTAESWAWTSGSTEASVTLLPGEEVTCTFTNRSSAPLAVDLASFTVEGTGPDVEVAWETTAEQGTIGFNLYRARTAQGPWERINPTLIPAQAPGGAGGATYAWADKAPGAGSFWYALEDVTLTGEATRHEPVEVILVEPNAVRTSQLSATRSGLGWIAGLAVLVGLAALAIKQVKGLRAG